MIGRLLIAIANLFILLRNGLRRLLRRRVDYVYIEISGELPEFTNEVSLVQRLLGISRLRSMAELRHRFRRIANDPQAHGVILVLRNFAPGWSTAESLRDELHALRAGGKRAVVYLPGADTRTYFAASAADEIVMPETAYLNLLGLFTEVTFLRDALQRVGIEAEVTAVSPYKSGGDTFVRSDLSPESREQLDRILDQRYQQLVATVAEGRSLSPERVQELIDTAPHTAPTACSLGLIDGVCYEDELATRLAPQPDESDKAADKADKQPRPVIIHRWRVATRALRIPYRRYRRRGVAVVSIEGAITTGRSRVVPIPLPLLGGKQAGSDSVAQMLRQVERNDRIAALVLHVDSPGGDSFASDLIWREVLRVRQKKPVVVSMGNVAASGGYYVAACANAIVAQPGTLTGSIGVFSLFPVTEKLLDKTGITNTVLSRGARADLFDTTRHPGDDQRAVLRRLVFESYDSFKQRVCQGRNLNAQQLEPVAGGRVWTGAEAQQHGLVDDLGGFRAALAKARQLAELPEEHPPVLQISLPMRRDTLLPQPFPAENPAAVSAFLHEWLQPRIMAALPWSFKE
jgi:protease-4